MKLLVALLTLTCVPSKFGQGCDPCIGVPASTFKTKPGTACREYVQCINGVDMGTFACSGDTVYDEKVGYCNWPTNFYCVEPSCPPSPGAADTPRPSPNATPPPSDAATPQPSPAGECANPCPTGATGFYLKPRARCRQYVSCDEGQIVEEMECNPGMFYNNALKYCDWETNGECEDVDCPERDETDQPTAKKSNPPPTGATGNSAPPPTWDLGPIPTGDSEPFPAPAWDQVEVQAERGDANVDTDCPNPCPVDFTGLKPKPLSDCQSYVECEDGRVVQDLDCTTGSTFDPDKGSCEWYSANGCQPVECPERPETPSPVAVMDLGVVGTDDTAEGLSFCINPCPISYSGYIARPDTDCKQYVQCEDGQLIGDFECDGSHFVQELQECGDLSTTSRESEERCPPVACPDATEEPTTLAPTTRAPSKKPTTGPTRPVYESIRDILLGRQELFESIILQSEQGPSSAYTFPDFMSALQVSVYELPLDKSFFIGLGVAGRREGLSSIEYGLVNMAAFLTTAMAEGIRIDSCDEWNVDQIFDRLPLSNSCGQHGRSYNEEICRKEEPFHCPKDTSMYVTAVNSPPNSKVPPMECRPREVGQGREVFPGFFDTVDSAVVQSAFANTLGETRIESCCYWGRGALMTRGRCVIGKLSTYVGMKATERGVFVYPDLDTCSDPELICTHAKTMELRWLVGMLEWADRVQSYVHPKWSYQDELKAFVDGGMEDDQFIETVTNIVTHKCHDLSCEDKWDLNQEEHLRKDDRRSNFKRIIDLFDLPLTIMPSKLPTRRPSPPPTMSPVVPVTDAPVTNKPTSQETIIDLESNATSSWLNVQLVYFFCFWQIYFNIKYFN